MWMGKITKHEVIPGNTPPYQNEVRRLSGTTRRFGDSSDLMAEKEVPRSNDVVAGTTWDRRSAARPPKGCPHTLDAPVGALLAIIAEQEAPPPPSPLVLAPHPHPYPHPPLCGCTRAQYRDLLTEFLALIF